MEAVTLSTDLLISQNRRNHTFKDYYKIDFWKEAKKRWLMFGVLLSILTAVVSPRLGAPGGPLHSEYVWHGALWCVYYSAGRRCRRPRASLATTIGACALTATHAHVVTPAIYAFVGTFADDAGLHRTLIKGALLSSAGGPCGWLSLCVCGDVSSASLLLVAHYAASLLAAPLTLYLICGRAPLPALGPSVWSALWVVPPFIAGIIYTYTQTNRRHTLPYNCVHKPVTDCIRCATDCSQCIIDCTQCVRDCTQCITDCGECNTRIARSMEQCVLLSRLCALLLLYFDCCERLREAEGSLHWTDVLGTMMFVVSMVSLCALSCALCARYVSDHDLACALPPCALPKAFHAGWVVSGGCVPGGLARLPCVFAAPAQALLLAALPSTHAS